MGSIVRQKGQSQDRKTEPRLTVILLKIQICGKSELIGYVNSSVSSGSPIHFIDAEQGKFIITVDKHVEVNYFYHLMSVQMMQ